MCVNVSADSKAILHSDFERCHKMSVHTDREKGTVLITLRITNTPTHGVPHCIGVPTLTGVFRVQNRVSNVHRAVLLTAG
jgi:hypothetical protein